MDSERVNAAHAANAPGPAPGPLSGLRVLECGSIVAAPFAARLLADLGAEVIKIEHPVKHDPLRTWGHVAKDGRHLWWPVSSRNKRLVTLDLGHEHGAELFLRLAAESDVLIENFRAGTLEGWNLGPDRLHEVKPALVIGRISGFGQTGPYARRPGYAAVAEHCPG
jgi:formyl-CoA transferase